MKNTILKYYLYVQLFKKMKMDENGKKKKELLENLVGETDEQKPLWKCRRTRMRTVKIVTR